MSRDWVAHRLATGLPEKIIAVPPSPSMSPPVKLTVPHIIIRGVTDQTAASIAPNTSSLFEQNASAHHSTHGDHDARWLKGAFCNVSDELGHSICSPRSCSAASNQDARASTHLNVLLTAGTRAVPYVSAQHSAMPRPISHRDMRHVDNDIFGVTRRLHGSDRGLYHDLHPGVSEKNAFKAGAYAAQLVRGAPGDPDGHAGLGVMDGWVGLGAGRHAAETAHRYPWRKG